MLNTLINKIVSSKTLFIKHIDESYIYQTNNKSPNFKKKNLIILSIQGSYVLIELHHIMNIRLYLYVKLNRIILILKFPSSINISIYIQQNDKNSYLHSDCFMPKKDEKSTFQQFFSNAK